MLQLHRVQIDTAQFTKDVTVLATSKEAACQAASRQAGLSIGPIVGVTYLGVAEGVVLGDVPWQTADTVEFVSYGGS